MFSFLFQDMTHTQKPHPSKYVNTITCVVVLAHLDSCLPFARKAVFIPQQLSKPPRRHGSLDQPSPLRSSPAHSSCSRQFNLLTTCHKHKLSFLTICESFNGENPTLSESQSFFPRRIPAIWYIPPIVLLDCFTDTHKQLLSNQIVWKGSRQFGMISSTFNKLYNSETLMRYIIILSCPLLA